MTMAIAAMALAGCVPKDQIQTVPEAPPPVPATKPTVKMIDLTKLCVIVKTYTPAEEKALADAVSALPATNPVITAMGDYRRMREDGRACIAKAKNP